MTDRLRAALTEVLFIDTDEVEKYQIQQRLGFVQFSPAENAPATNLRPANPFPALIQRNQPASRFAAQPRLKTILDIPDPQEQRIAKDYMQREARRKGGNAILGFHWQSKTIRKPITTPGRSYRAPFSERPDPRNYVRSFDRQIQTPPTTRYVEQRCQVFYGEIVRVEAREN